MINQPPFELRIFVADGDPYGWRLVTRSNRTGKGIVFPRVLFTQVRNRHELQQTGVYLSVDPRSEGNGEMLYVGEGDPVLDRLKGHYAGKDFWTRAVSSLLTRSTLRLKRRRLGSRTPPTVVTIGRIQAGGR